MWLQALGAGAMNWDKEDIPAAPLLAISDVALNPEDYDGQVIQLSGFMSKSIAPDVSFGTARLGDHPNYGNSNHQIGMTIHSATGEWIEAGSKVTVQGVSPTNNESYTGILPSKDPKLSLTEITPLKSRCLTGPHNRHGCTHLAEPSTLQVHCPSSTENGNLMALLALLCVSYQAKMMSIPLIH